MSLPLVLLPGMMCDARLFAPQIEALSRTHAVHYAPISAHSDIRDLANDVLRHAPPRFALAGLSMGGIVAMEIVRQAPDRVDRLALLDTNPLDEMPEIALRRAPQIEAAQNGQLADVMRNEMKPHYLADGPDRARILDLCMEMALGLGAEVFVRQSLALRDRPDQSDTLRGYTGKSLVLCGAEDRLCPLKRHTLMHELLPNSVLTVIEGAGHLTTLEKPTETTIALKEWLEISNG